MGCKELQILDYTVYFCSLEPIQKDESKYKINLIAEENLIKEESIKFLNQIGEKNNPEITKFLERPHFQSNTIFYYFLGVNPLIKNFNQSTKYVPFNFPQLSKIFLLSTDSVIGIPNEAIENETKFLKANKFIGEILNLTEVKKRLEEANNPNISKDDLSLKENKDNEEESVKEKEDEIRISEEVTNNTYMNLVSKFENGREGTNDKINNTNNSIKFAFSKFPKLNIFNNIMNLLEEKKIKKFSFYENNINADFEGWIAISDFFKHNYSLRYIDLHACNLYDYHLNLFTRALIDKRIRFLDLSENFLTIDGVEIIASYLKNNKTLKKLNLSRNAQSQFKSDGVKLIIDALITNPNIESIDFSYMILTGCGQAIGNLISDNKSIENIYLRNVQLNAVDFKNIFEPLKYSKVLKEIDISFNDMGGDRSLHSIADGISENKSLNSIKMDKININNDNYKIIFDAIEKNNTIKSYSVSYNSNLKITIMLNFFIKQKQVKRLEYEPFDKENPEDMKKQLTLEDKKLFEKFKTDRPDMELIYK